MGVGHLHRQELVAIVPVLRECRSVDLAETERLAIVVPAWRRIVLEEQAETALGLGAGNHFGTGRVSAPGIIGSSI
jgi:hypothetical protein